MPPVRIWANHTYKGSLSPLFWRQRSCFPSQWQVQSIGCMRNSGETSTKATGHAL